MKGQAAMEFFMTYGWAILGLAAAIGGLTYFNIFNTTKYYPEECILFDKVSCITAKASFSSTPNRIELVARNEYGQLLNPFNITILSDQGCNNNQGTASGGLTDGEEEKITITCTSTLPTEGRYQAILNISFTGTSGTPHNAYGKLVTQVE